MHPVVLVLLGLLFLAVQLYVYWRARSSLDANVIAWRAEMGSGAGQRRGADEARARLETSLAYEPWRLGLKRLGVAAPLFGMLITAFGFIFMNVDEQKSSPRTIPNPPRTAGEREPDSMPILQQLGPLYSGVLIGGLLGLINQGLLWRLDYHLSRQRISSEALVRASRHHGDSTNVLVEFEETVRSITQQAAARIAQVTAQAESQANQWVQSSSLASKMLGQIVEDYEKNRGQATVAASELRQAAQEVIRQIGASVKAAADSLAREASAIGNALEKGKAGIEAASEGLAAPAGRLAGIVSSLDGRVKALAASSQTFQDAATAALEGARQVGESLRKTIDAELGIATAALQSVARECVSGSQALKGAGQSLQESARAMDQGSQTLNTSTHEFSRQLPELNKALGSLTSCLAGHQSLLAGTSAQIASLMRSLGDEMARNVNQHADKAGQDLRAGIEAQLRAAGATISQAADAYRKTTDALAKVVQELNTSAQSANSSAKQMTAATEQFDKTLSGLGQSVERLASGKTRSSGRGSKAGRGGAGDGKAGGWLDWMFGRRN